MSSCQSSKTALEADKAFVLCMESSCKRPLANVVATDCWTVCINTRQCMHLFGLLVIVRVPSRVIRLQVSLKAGLQNLRERVVTLVRSYQARFASSGEPWNIGRPWTLPFPLLHHDHHAIMPSLCSCFFRSLPAFLFWFGNCWHDVGMMLAAGNVQLSDLPNHCRLMQRRSKAGWGLVSFSASGSRGRSPQADWIGMDRYGFGMNGWGIERWVT